MSDKDYLTSDFVSEKPKKFSPKELTETKKPVIVKPETNDVSDIISVLKTLILDDIDRIKKDPNYVHQAKAVNNHVNSVINLAKLQYEILKNKR